MNSLFIRDKIYILEFKVCQGSCSASERALKQIKERRYYEKYLGEDKEIYLLGIEFDKQKRNISRLDWERLR